MTAPTQSNPANTGVIVMTEVERIAKGLSRIERSILAYIQSMTAIPMMSFEMTANEKQAARDLRKMGAVKTVCGFWTTTPLGIKVRAYLEKEATHVSN